MGNEKSGRLNYMTFSKWLGNSIHMAEGFYFRHDSTKNPLQERFLQIDQQNKGADYEYTKNTLITQDEEDKILEKIKF